SESEKPSESAKPTVKPTETESDEPTEAPKNDDQTPTQSPKQDEDPLADTGSSSVPLIAAGGALALVGAMFLLFRRGNRRHS
ncbi:LPXTG cell wall anchor domain-containing protein, partial [Glutamicibacter ardleyensis]|uniref:LPXTG cell wall anchor domain-containing protein n=1 Tax=Glutamicibacter ardleyensis TaxID=225894 RepID=UPI003FD4BD27